MMFENCVYTVTNWWQKRGYHIDDDDDDDISLFWSIEVNKSWHIELSMIRVIKATITVQDCSHPSVNQSYKVCLQNHSKMQKNIRLCIFSEEHIQYPEMWIGLLINFNTPSPEITERRQVLFYLNVIKIVVKVSRIKFHHLIPKCSLAEKYEFSDIILPEVWKLTLQI